MRVVSIIKMNARADIVVSGMVNAARKQGAFDSWKLKRTFVNSSSRDFEAVTAVEAIERPAASAKRVRQADLATTRVVCQLVWFTVDQVHFLG